MTKKEKFIGLLMENYEKMKWTKNINGDFESSFSHYTIVVGTPDPTNEDEHYVRVLGQSSKQSYAIYSTTVYVVNDLYDLVKDFANNKDELNFWDNVLSSFEINVIY